MSTIFTKIINREFPAFIVDETDDFIAILAKGQVQEGHTLVIPKIEVNSYLDMTNYDFGRIAEYAKTIAAILKKTYPDKERIMFDIAGFEVPHLHIHLIPGNSSEEVYRTIPTEYSDDKMQIVLEKILKNK